MTDAKNWRNSAPRPGFASNWLKRVTAMRRILAADSFAWDGALQNNSVRGLLLDREISLTRPADTLNRGKVPIADVPYVMSTRNSRCGDQEVHGGYALAAPREPSPYISGARTDVPRDVEHL